MTMRFSALALVLSCGTLAQAQIAVPPSAPIAPTKPYIAPPEPPQAKPLDGKGVDVSPTPAPAPVALPDLPYESLAKKGPDGKLPVLSEPVEWAALRINPTIQSPEDKAKVKLILDERLHQYQLVAIENIDFMTEIDNGLLDKLDITATTAKPNVIKIRALAGKGTLVKSLKESKALSDMQIRFNSKISEERSKAEYESAAADKKGKAEDISKSVLRMAVSESMHARRVLFISATGKIADLGPKFGISADAIAAATSAKTDDTKFEAVRNAVKALPVDKQRDFLKAALGA